MEKGKYNILNFKLYYIIQGIIVFVAIIIIGASMDGTNKTTSSNTNNNITNNNVSNTNTANTTKIEKVKVEIIDFSQMSKADIEAWCKTNKIRCSFTETYSDTVGKGLFVSQSTNAGNTIEEGEKITISYSLGKEPTREQKNALKKAETYSSTMHMSKAGIYKQLTSEYGEGFTAEAAQYAIDNMVADWKANALAKAKTYQTSMNMSKSAIYKQLISEYGEGFTTEEAQYAIDNLGD